jgi:hypothetical protein
MRDKTEEDRNKHAIKETHTFRSCLSLSPLSLSHTHTQFSHTLLYFSSVCLSLSVFLSLCVFVVYASLPHDVCFIFASCSSFHSHNRLADIITVHDASDVRVGESETFEQFTSKPLPKASDVLFGDVCIVLFKAKVLHEGKFRVQPAKVIKIGTCQAAELDDDVVFIV